ncbi:hypothetical protein F4821DRAFT_227769 [Hypoxylon rubiginosum]|uniref:Uncharacterized protein n=1 Tax=Hypoxylon rubiginosum TaxID=110542 RepID=A0ACC0DDM5_9PEZI|nr:hypothetical protein F4821DRAFT_227769 [Hypoxylon rubiginosum]
MILPWGLCRIRSGLQIKHWYNAVYALHQGGYPRNAVEKIGIRVLFSSTHEQRSSFRAAGITTHILLKLPPTSYRMPYRIPHVGMANGPLVRAYLHTGHGLILLMPNYSTLPLVGTGLISGTYPNPSMSWLWRRLRLLHNAPTNVAPSSKPFTLQQNRFPICPIPRQRPPSNSSYSCQVDGIPRLSPSPMPSLQLQLLPGGFLWRVTRRLGLCE